MKNTNEQSWNRVRISRHGPGLVNDFETPTRYLDATHFCKNEFNSNPFCSTPIEAQTRRDSSSANESIDSTKCAPRYQLYYWLH